MPQREVSGTLVALNDVSDSIVISGWGSFHLTGNFNAAVVVQCSKDGGATWAPMTLDHYAAELSVTAPVRKWFYEPEEGVLYRLRCSQFTSGSVNYWLTQCP